jgi:endonuclease-8
MAEGDTILRAARRLDAALRGETVAVSAPNPRGRATGVERLDGATLEGVEARGKNLVLRFGELVLHSHLGMNGAWHVYRRGAPWRKPRRSAWAVLAAPEAEAAQFGGKTLRVLRASHLAADPWLAALGPDILAPDLDLGEAVRSLRADPRRELGDALLDQSLIAGIGNIFKSEALFAARLDPWATVADTTDSALERLLAAARALMLESVASGRHPHAVYRRRGRPCPLCRGPIASRGQGDENRTTYWCPHCQHAVARVGSS